MNVGSSDSKCEYCEFVGERVLEGTLGLKGVRRACVSSAGVIVAVLSLL